MLQTHFPMAVTDWLKWFKKPTVKEYYLLHKEEILKLVATEHHMSELLGGLKYEFTGKNNLRWYSFPELYVLPFSRMAKGQEYFDWYNNGLAPDEFARITSGINLAFAHIRAKTKEADEQMVRAGLLITEMDERRARALPYFVLINLCANYLIREDENPNVINPRIHADKCDEIEAMLDAGDNAFFFNLPQLRRLSAMQSASPDQLTEYLQELKAESVMLNQKLKVYSFTSDVSSGTTI